MKFHWTIGRVSIPVCLCCGIISVRFDHAFEIVVVFSDYLYIL